MLDFKRESGQVLVPNGLPKSPDDHFYQYRQGTTSVKDATYLTLELSQFGDLFDVVKATGGFKSVPLTRFVFAQILEGTAHMHKCGYSHLDLKLDNILIGNDFKLKLCDFGMATKVD